MFLAKFSNKDLHKAFGDFGGRAAAANYVIHSKHLSEGFPALSDAAGRIPLEVSEDQNVEMPSLAEDWPLERGGDFIKGNSRRRWRHSDLKTIAYPYIYQVFNDWVQ